MNIHNDAATELAVDNDLPNSYQNFVIMASNTLQPSVGFYNRMSRYKP